MATDDGHDEAVALGGVGAAGDEDGLLDHGGGADVEQAPLVRLVVVVANVVVDGKPAADLVCNGGPVRLGLDHHVEEGVGVILPGVALVEAWELGVVGPEMFGFRQFHLVRVRVDGDALEVGHDALGATVLAIGVRPEDEDVFLAHDKVADYQSTLVFVHVGEMSHEAVVGFEPLNESHVSVLDSPFSPIERFWRHGGGQTHFDFLSGSTITRKHPEVAWLLRGEGEMFASAFHPLEIGDKWYLWKYNLDESGQHGACF